MFNVIRIIYAICIKLCSPLLRLHLQRRCLLGKEDKKRVREKEGISSVARPDGPVIWFHCASVGESMAVLPVIEKFLQSRDDATVLMTTGTLTSSHLMADRLPDRAIHQFAPLDHPGWVKRFLLHWKPVAVVWVESEFWPNTLWLLKQMDIPVMLVNGRISHVSYRRWRRLPSLIRGMLNCFDVCLAQTSIDAKHLSDLGARDVIVHGNLKLGADPLPVDDDALAALNKSIADRPYWLASSTHDGEEAIAARVHKLLVDRFPSILSIIVPRHAARGAEIVELLKGYDLNVALRSRNDALSDQTDVYVADTMGELGLFYRACDVVFMGKSLAGPGGGQNPFEPVKLGCAVLFGPNMGNFIELADAMKTSGAAKEVANPDALYNELANLLSNPVALNEQKQKAIAFSKSAEDIVNDTVMRINELVG